MTYDSYETSIEAGEPVELYEFSVGGLTFRFTSSENPLTLSGYEYAPDAIERNEIVNTTDEKQDRIEVRMPATNDFAARYMLLPPGNQATLTIRRIHRGDAEAIVYFKGVVHAVTFVENGTKALAAVLAITSARDREVPRHTYQCLCNHTLFDAGCGINEATYTHALTCTAASGETITLAGAGALGADYFVAGFLEYGGEYRTVIAQAGNVLTILVPFTTTPIGFSVSARAGCRLRLTTDCRDKFANAINFGGFPYVPTKNPFATGLD